ncbi:hypothetical protein ACHAWC_009979, partial [Mediolabrus comicus]
MSDNNSPTTKKRKANDGRVPNDGGSGLFSSWLGYFTGRRDDGTSPTASSTCGGENLTQKIDMMMQMMSRMEERCCRLETECSSLKNALEMKTNSIKEHVDSKFGKQHEFNSMLVRNQSWEYSASVHAAEIWEDYGYDEDEATYLEESSGALKSLTEKMMRQGEFPENYYDDRKGISFAWAEEDPILDRAAISKIRPHWEEFTDALKQFTPAFGVLPGGCETYFMLENIQLDRSVPELLKDALMNKPFQKLSLVNKTGVRGDEGMNLEDILDI